MIVNTSYLLNLQAAPNIEALWQIFLSEIEEQIPLADALLAYHTGVLFKTLTYQDKKITPGDIQSFPFLSSPEELDYRLYDQEFLIIRQINNYYIQAQLKFRYPIDPEQFRQYIVLTGHIFINQAYLLLRLENFEYHAVKDDITLAYNQKYLKNFIQNEIERCDRYGAYFSIVFFDLDNLKAVNEKHGHLIGTEVLKEVAALLRQQIRKSDLLSRFGGDEFVIILLRTNADITYEICKRIKTYMEETPFLQAKNLNIKMTGCFGIACCPKHGRTVDELIEKADTAMYSIKRQGKNGIKIYQGD